MAAWQRLLIVVMNRQSAGEIAGGHGHQALRAAQQRLAVRRGAGMDLLVQRFAAELKRFKQEPGYAALSARYGGIPSIAAASILAKLLSSSRMSIFKSDFFI